MNNDKNPWLQILGVIAESATSAVIKSLETQDKVSDSSEKEMYKDFCESCNKIINEWEEEITNQKNERDKYSSQGIRFAADSFEWDAPYSGANFLNQNDNFKRDRNERIDLLNERIRTINNLKYQAAERTQGKMSSEEYSFWMDCLRNTMY